MPNFSTLHSGFRALFCCSVNENKHTQANRVAYVVLLCTIRNKRIRWSSCKNGIRYHRLVCCPKFKFLIVTSFVLFVRIVFIQFDSFALPLK